MNPRVRDVKPVANFQLELTFSNGEIRVFDMKPYLSTGLFVQLKNETIFASVVSTMGSIQWKNGLDLCPDTLYEDSVPYNKIKNQEKDKRRK
jgi:hypothetical protein